MYSEEEKRILAEAERIRKREEAKKREAEDDPVLDSLRRNSENSSYSIPRGSEDTRPIYTQTYVYEGPEDDEDDAVEARRARRTSADTSDEKSVKPSGRKRKQSEADFPEEEPPRKKKRKKKHHPVRNILLILLVLVLLVFLGGTLLGSRMEYIPVEKSAEDPSWNLPAAHKKGVYNILIIGTDARSETDDSRSDCMIIASICPLQHKVYLTSVLRDSYVDIPGYGQNRINHAYQMGGVKLLSETIAQNFHIRIDNYVKFDFFSFIDIIDALGGVEITLTEGEVNYVNGYLAEINTILGLPVDDGCIYSGPGTYTLSGKQALSYARIRYIGTDFARTERQRIVIQAAVKKLKHTSPVKLVQLLDRHLPSLKTDIKNVRFGLLTLELPYILTGKMESYSIPYDGTWVNALTPNGQEVLQIDFANVIAIFNSLIYK